MSSKSKHIFAVDPNECYPGIGEKLQKSVIKKVNEIDKTVNVAPIDEFQNLFIVRAGTLGNELYREQNKGYVQNIGYLTLHATDDPSKKAQFGVWKRMHSSLVLV